MSFSIGGSKKKVTNTTNNYQDNSQTTVSTTLSGDGNVSGSGNVISTTEINEDVVAIGADLLTGISADQTNLLSTISADQTDLAIEATAAVTSAASKFAGDATDLAIEAIAGNVSAIDSANNVVTTALDNSFAYGELLAMETMNKAGQLNQGVSDMVLATINGQNDYGMRALDFTENIAQGAQALSLDTTALVADSMNQNTDSVLGQLNAGFANMGQFMSNATRSDASLMTESIAKTNSKMMQTIFLGFGALTVVGLGVAMFKGKK